MNHKDPKQVIYSEHQFEILLKEDFLDLYLKQDYEQKVSGTTCTHHDRSVLPEGTTPFKSFNGSHIISENSPYRSSFIGGVNKSALPPKGYSPCKVRLTNGETRNMTEEEIRNKYLAYVASSLLSRKFDPA